MLDERTLALSQLVSTVEVYKNVLTEFIDKPPEIATTETQAVLEDAVDIVARHLYKCDVGSDDEADGTGGGDAAGADGQAARR